MKRASVHRMAEGYQSFPRFQEAYHVLRWFGHSYQADHDLRAQRQRTDISVMSSGRFPPLPYPPPRPKTIVTECSNTISFPNQSIYSRSRCPTLSRSKAGLRLHPGAQHCPSMPFVRMGSTTFCLTAFRSRWTMPDGLMEIPLPSRFRPLTEALSWTLRSLEGGLTQTRRPPGPPCGISFLGAC